MIITLTDVDDGDLTAESYDSGVEIQEVSRTEHNGSTTVSITYRLTEENEATAEEDEDSIYETGYRDGMRDGGLERGQKQQTFDFNSASAASGPGSIYGLNGQGSLGSFDVGNRRPTAR